MIYQAILGGISNRIRGYGIKIFFINQDHLNAYLFGFCFMQQWWHLLVLWLGMIGGASTGWSEFLGGTRGDYTTSPSKFTWISKILVIKNQWTCFIWGCIRALIWVLPIYVAFLLCGDNKWGLFFTIPFFYASYRLGYLVRKNGDSTEVGEIIWGALFWATCGI